MQVPETPYIDSPKEVAAVKHREALLSWLAGDLPGEVLPGQSLLELTGDRQILIENHRGVTAYSREHIGVLVSFGEVVISGQCLELARMTQGQLVITGTVQSISLCRRCL